MKHSFRTIAAMFLLAALPLSLMSQTDSSTPATSASGKRLFTLDDLIPGGATYYQRSYAATRYVGFWGERPVRLDIDQCALINPRSGAESTLFTLAQLNAILPTGHQLHSLYGVQFPDADAPLALVSTSARRFLVNWEKRTVDWQQPVDADATASDFHPTSRSEAFVKDHNLFVTLADGTTHPVSTDGSLDITYGESVHRDEFGITKGTFWSPKGTLLAFYRMDQSMVSTYPQVDISPKDIDDLSSGTSRIARLVPDKYPMAGEESHRVQVGVFNPATRTVCYLKTGDPTDRYFTNLSWSPDERTLYLIEVNRDQNHARLDAYDAATGRRLRTLFEESDPKYFEPCAPIRFLPWDASRFVYLSRRDGFLHLYLYRLDRQGEARLERQLTSGAYEVFDIVGFNTREHTVLFTSNRSLQTGCTTHAVSLAGRITPVGGQQGWHTPKASAEGTLLADNWQSPDVARRIDLVGTRAGQQPVSYFQAADPWEGYAVPDIRVGTIKAADGTTDLHYRLILPTDFDPTRKYPAIIYVYGGPHAHVVDATRNYGARGWDIWMAQRGYVMLSLDNRGSEHRGRDFEQATFRQLGVEEMKDQLEGVRLLKSLPYVDADRLGVHGWSFGGYMTTSLLTTYPGTFKVGVAGGPVIDWRYYEVMYGERYMDTPQANPEGYERTSLIKKAGNLRDRLLIIYGGNDPTCVPQHTLSFLKACVEAGTHPDLFIYPGHGHNMTGTDRVHLHEHITRYFDDFLRR